MPYTVKDGLEVSTPSNLVSAINQMAGQIKRILGGDSWLDAPSFNLAGANIYKSASPPSNPTIGDYWDEFSSQGLPISQLAWNGLYWLERTPRFLNIASSNGIPAAIPWGQSSTIIFIERFTTVVTGGEANNTNNFYEYRLMNANSANATLGITIASNFSKTPSGRREYSVDVNTVYTTKPLALAVYGFKNGNSVENPNYSGHTIQFRLGRG